MGQPPQPPQGQPRTLLVWDEALLAYDFGPGHPMSPVRLDLTMRLCRDLGLLDRVELLSPEPLTDEALRRVHTQDFIDAVRRASSAGDSGGDLHHGLGTDDVPVFAGMHQASARVAGGSMAVAQAVWSGQVQHGVNLAGGLHHAMPDAASGFCVYNDAALAVAALLDAGAERVAYVDVDVHHGDGVQAAFWNDPRVLTVSVHETGTALFPGTGFSAETGGPRAPDSAVNLALPVAVGDAAWLRAFHAVVPAVVRAFDPQVLVTQQGCDSHVLDPLSHMALSVDAQRASYLALHALAHEVCGGRWVALGGGGYEALDVVPRAWAHLVAVAAHVDLPPATEVPAGWLTHVATRWDRRAPARMTDDGNTEFSPWSEGVDPEDPVDQAVMATRRAVFPGHGLDPLHD